MKLMVFWWVAAAVVTGFYIGLIYVTLSRQEMLDECVSSGHSVATCVQEIR